MATYIFATLIRYTFMLMHRNVLGNKRLNTLQHQHLSNPLPQREKKEIADLPQTKTFYCHKKCDENQLFPTDYLTRLHASTIFKADGPFLLNDDGDNDSNSLSENVHKNIQAFKRAMQRRTLCIRPQTYTTMKQMALDNIITSNYLLHVALSASTLLCPLFSAHDQAQIEFDNTSWIFKQQDDIDNESLRHDNILYYQHQEEVVEIGYGEVKKLSASQALFNKDKIRALEIMRRQLHLCLCRAKKAYESVTFNVLVQKVINKFKWKITIVEASGTSTSNIFTP
ncbi:hypothetical protein J3Q64DRAFT_1693617 [Phycomyces blakesleeanus]|uniref:Uncharacterized protein n=2 Tax=Phycomyces blakesleeanus TaxID=4837 RepID=A0A162T697_PHYB8|nr:hypothetical protein PHYBLDRAFT_175071 [Phycomyces blakesleeanus NRRL 1555(-)]OAD66522.1 hypothetical protein PHYBLDRAFT_175071 [Phycomyces blakesleeanus NRRL 1555(-)]|eukprot:XP_018284562.1 hypothetical protein PHYBLDRAFT_175071 [Phycomyces blakesleeanus NRRL 1555(-)]